MILFHQFITDVPILDGILNDWFKRNPTKDLVIEIGNEPNVYPYISPKPKGMPQEEEEEMQESIFSHLESILIKILEKRKSKTAGKMKLHGRNFASFLYCTGWFGLSLSVLGFLRSFLAPQTLDKPPKGFWYFLATAGSVEFFLVVLVCEA